MKKAMKNSTEGLSWFARLASAAADRMDPSRVHARLWRRLMEAIGEQSLEKTQAALAEGADPNVNVEGPDFPLHKAAKHGSVAICEALLKAGARVDDVSGHGRRALHDALESSQGAGKAKLLLSWGAAPNAIARDDIMPLRISIHLCEAEMTKALLDAGADPNQASRAHPGVGPLGVAANFDKLDHAKLLVERGADVEEALAGNRFQTEGQTWGWLRSWSEEKQLRPALQERAASRPARRARSL